MKSSMQILKVEPGKPPVVAGISGTLESMQAVVGGTIQAIYPFDDSVALVCNDDGKLLGLPLNRTLYSPETGMPYDVIAGTFFLSGAPADSNHFTGMTDAQVHTYQKLFAVPELFLSINDRIIVARGEGGDTNGNK